MRIAADMLNKIRLIPHVVCCRRRPWLCVADWLTGCKVARICDAHDRHIATD